MLESLEFFFGGLAVGGGLSSWPCLTLTNSLKLGRLGSLLMTLRKP
jgi:hypothetical protein